MGKQVIVTAGERIPRVFENLSEASEGIGASETAISIAIREGRECKGVLMRWVDRVFLVRSKKGDGDWVVAKLNAHNTAFYPFDQRKKSIRVVGASDVKDITACWYR